MRTLIAPLAVLFLSGCISPQFVKSSPGHFEPRGTDSVAVFYSPKDVPFDYNEVGRIFLKGIYQYNGNDQALQIRKIRGEAAAQGADAVIVSRDIGYAGSGSAFGAIASSNEATVYHYSGIAIVKK